MARRRNVPPTAFSYTAHEKLVSLAEGEVRAFDAWQNSDDDSPDQYYWAAFEEMLAAFLEPVPGTFHHAVEPMRVLGRAYAEHKLSGSEKPQLAFWRARREAIAAVERKPPTLPPLETIDELVNVQKVSRIQAAKIWRLTDATGAPKLHLVEQELKSPGSVLTPEHVAWVEGCRMAEAGFGPPPDLAGKTPKPPRPVATAAAPDSLETLILQLVPAVQIAAIKNGEHGRDEAAIKAGAAFTPELVLAMARAMGVDLPASATAALAQESKRQAERKHGKAAVETADQSQLSPPTLKTREFEPPTETDNPDPDADEQPPAVASSEPLSLEDEVIQLFESGHDPDSIAERLGFAKRKVNKIIRDYGDRRPDDGELEEVEVGEDEV